MSQNLNLTDETSALGSKPRDSVVYNVEQLNSHIRQTLEGQLGVVWLQAEISNFKPHSSGHFYFSLKDSRAQISAIMFRGHNSKLRFKPHDGLEVIVRGRITVYEPRGTYQIVCESMEPVGAGALQKQFEQLKEKLKLEGLFEASRKKPIPHYPRHVAIVTSPTGAAIQDILNIMSRRARNVELTIVPALVQGAGAATSLCEAFSKASKLPVDVIIIGRGGGSMEDLWSFNDEKLARLIAAAELPVISAVGHEVDFTICDFVADLRAPTPSAAAELVAKSSTEITQRLTQLDRLLNLGIQKLLKLKMHSLILNNKRLVDPKKKLHDYAFRNDELLTRLEQAIKVYIAHLSKDVQILEKKLTSPKEVIQRLRERISRSQLILNKSMQSRLDKLQYKLKNNMGMLDTLSPLNVVERGFSITTKNKKVIKSVKDVKKSDVIEVKVTDGIIEAEIINIK
ncbi:exodeoxyribonuclease VII large subunit [bacterium]|nr:exodeoxyribonuclease VII large subunit [bacterium]